jgi:Cu-Zn family superoxide dismutase
MKLVSHLAAAALVAVLTPLAPGTARASDSAKTEGSAVLTDAAGKEVGKATFAPAKDGVTLMVRVEGLKPGLHGIHVHGVGKCEGPEFTSAGGHFNPAGKKHGLVSPMGHHGGDLPNLRVGADGKGELSAKLAGVSLGEGQASLFHDGGTALVIHGGEDDEKTDPAGNSGPRVACGVIHRGS